MMTRLIRVAAFLAGSSVFLAGPGNAAKAKVPSWTNSTQPETLRIRTGGYAPGVNNFMAIRYTMRDIGYTPSLGVRVAIDFSACGEIEVCPQSQQQPGTTVNGAVVSRLTDRNGEVVFIVRAKGTTGPPSSLPCATVAVYLDGTFAGNGSPLSVAVFDLTDQGIGASDLAVWMEDANACAAGTYRARSDYIGPVSPTAPTTCPGSISALDLSVLAAYLNELPFGAGGGPSCGWADTNP